MTDERGSLATRATPLAVGLIVVALAAVVAAGGLPTADTAPTGDEVLDRVEQRYDSAETLAGAATVTVENATYERSANLSFVLEKPNSSRVSVAHNWTELVAGTNGTVAWVYDPTNDTAWVRELPENASAWNGTAWNGTDGAKPEFSGSASTAAGNHNWANVTRPDYENASLADWFEENVSVELVRTTTYEGREAHVLELEPENESYRGTATVWVDTEDYRVHEIRAGYGENWTTIAFDNQQFNASVHESTFKPPDAASVNSVSRERYDTFEDAQANTAIELQRLDADGYEFSEAVVVTRNGWTVVTQQYTGEANVSVVATADDLPYGLNATDGENVTVAGEPATYVDREDGAAVIWEEGDVTRAVVGDLSRETILDLAEHVRS